VSKRSKVEIMVVWPAAQYVSTRLTLFYFSSFTKHFYKFNAVADLGLVSIFCPAGTTEKGPGEHRM